MTTELRIGTSGWHYKHWIGTFYPPRFPSSKMLAFYLRHFDTVEVNNSFYHLPPETAVANWRDTTPPDFRFAVKGSRFLTHMKKLKDPKAGIEKFFSRADILGEKLGPVLFQLPPQWELNLERLEAFLRALPAYHRYGFEFRNETWNVGAVYDLLARYNAAYCAFDLAGFQSPMPITADFAYVRLHGPGGKYQGSYSAEALGAWAGRIAEWSKTLQGVYVYFDNDEAAYAADNALTLKRMLQTSRTS